MNLVKYDDCYYNNKILLGYILNNTLKTNIPTLINPNALMQAPKINDNYCRKLSTQTTQFYIFSVNLSLLLIYA